MAMHTQAMSKAHSSAPTITITKLDIGDKSIRISYEIKNNTNHDFWIFDGIGEYDVSADVLMDEDDQTLLIRGRLDVPAQPGRSAPLFDGGYGLLPSGSVLSESISLTMPVHSIYGYAGGRERRGLEYATRLVIEFGYYDGDLPGIIRAKLTEEAKVRRKMPLVRPNRAKTLDEWFEGLGLLRLNEMNERLFARDEKFLLPYTDKLLKGELTVRATVDGLRIPCIEDLDEPTRGLEPPNLTSCTKIEIEYQPSALDCYFPCASSRSLLSDEEIRQLGSVRTVIVEDKEDLKSISDDVAKGIPTMSGVIRQRNVAYITCYNKNENPTVFPIFHQLHSLVYNGDLFTREEGFQSLMEVTPQLPQLELRVRCAANLKDLWNRIRLFHEAEKNRTKDSFDNDEVKYPKPTEWCDTMVPAYRSIGMLDYWILKPYKCPSANEGRCHYAMNPNCRPDSPADMVLLSETTDGWNQHGRPELFTFDNHDPKGGCVLLNDGTVNFIRTAEELRQLRWE